jgi:adenylate kinase family enzyme
MQHAQAMLKVLLFGNLGAGKSHLAERVLLRLPAFDLHSIDAYRRQRGDGSIEAERSAKDSFIDAVVQGRRQLIEATGLGETGILLAERLVALNEPVLVVLLTTPLDVCLARLNARIWDVPYPAPPADAFELARRTDALIQAGEVDVLWGKLPRTTMIKGDCSDERSMNELLERITQHLEA